jgi:hypothetical protein
MTTALGDLTQKRGRPPKLRPEAGESMPKRPKGRPRKAIDPDHPMHAPRPVGRPRTFPTFGPQPEELIHDVISYPA